MLANALSDASIHAHATPEIPTKASGVTGSGERPVAAVLDASLFDKGKFRTQSVSRLAQDLGKRGFELWIPRQIIFEWAAHAKPDVAALRTTYKAAQDAGLVAAQELPSSDAADPAEAIGAADADDQED